MSPPEYLPEHPLKHPLKHRLRTRPDAKLKDVPRRSAPALTLAAIALTTVFAAGLTGCASDVPMRAAENSNDPACADVIVRLPETVAGQEKRHTNAQATGAWGDPVAIELTCGIIPSGPTTDDCVNVNGVDWIIDRSAAPLYRFEAYGRNPGLQVIVDSERVSGTDTVLGLTQVTELLPQENKCTSLTDTLEFD